MLTSPTFFKWHPEFAPRYVEIVHDTGLIASFMSVAEMRHGHWTQAGHLQIAFERLVEFLYVGPICSD